MMLGAEKEPMPVINVRMLELIKAGMIYGNIIVLKTFHVDAPRLILASNDRTVQLLDCYGNIYVKIDILRTCVNKQDST